MGNLLPNNSLVVILLLLLSCLAAIQIISMLGGPSGGKKKRAPTRRKSKGAALQLLLLFLLSLTALVLLFFSVFFYQYTPLRGRTLAAAVEFSQVGAENSTFEAIITPYDGDQPQEKSAFSLRGGSWSIQAEILQWPPFLAKVGMRPMYRLTRLSSHSGNGGSGKKGTVIDLAGSSSGALWRTIAGVNNLFKLGRVTVVQSERAAPVWAGRYDLYADLSGLELERRRSERRDAGNEDGKEGKSAPPAPRRYPRRPEDYRH